MSAEQLIHSYGYLALLIGALMEGETILVLAGFAAHLGYLGLPQVIVIAALATIFCDQFVYFMGNIYGQGFLERRPAFKARTARFRALLKRYQNLVVFGFRFLYGMRIVAPFVIGMSGIAVQRFVILNIISAFFWAAVFSVGGYFFGATLQLIIGDIRKYGIELMIIMGAAGLLIWLVLMYRDKIRKKNNE
jgi:membrane protein DedA with SNARE-associated domain